LREEWPQMPHSEAARWRPWRSVSPGSPQWRPWELLASSTHTKNDLTEIPWLGQGVVWCGVVWPLSPLNGIRKWVPSHVFSSFRRGSIAGSRFRMGSCLPLYKPSFRIPPHMTRSALINLLKTSFKSPCPLGGGGAGKMPY